MSDGFVASMLELHVLAVELAHRGPDDGRDIGKEAAHACGYSGYYTALHARWPADRCAQILTEWRGGAAA